MKRKVRTMVKRTKMLRVLDLLQDFYADLSDEKLLQKYDLTWEQLGKAYEKLFYGGYLTKAEMERRLDLREGANTSHIPYVEIVAVDRIYECLSCGYVSGRHFSSCPRCRHLNVRRLSKSWLGVFRPEGYGSH